MNVHIRRPNDIPDPFANRQANRPGLMDGGPLSGPAQILSSAINNGTLRFDGNNEETDDDMDAEAEDQYNKSPSTIEDHAMIEDTSPFSPSSSSSTNANNTSSFSSSTPSSSTATSTSAPSEHSFNSSSSDAQALSDSSTTPEKLSSLSPPSAVRGVTSASPRQKKGGLENNKNDEVPHPSVQADGLMDQSEDPLKN